MTSDRLFPGDLIKVPFHGGGPVKRATAADIAPHDQVSEVADVWDLPNGGQRFLSHTLYHCKVTAHPIMPGGFIQEIQGEGPRMVDRDGLVPGHYTCDIVGFERLDDGTYMVFGRAVGLGETRSKKVAG